MKKYIFIFMLLITPAATVAGIPATPAEATCRISQDAKEMAVRVAKVVVETLARTNDQEVLELVKKTIDALLPPKCK